ncbi:hypothetical protein [Burkholderia cenocepacia]|uniref:hypothetical protein n=1 Tax=Burkholderia cenocepacia TaxID=95486 RepID=UPI001CF34082|nr:hypothetical protein [Burkholderia cenocepacia]MCA8234495.1 hypothetical protein [Burkholderia cenocepacia]
MTRPNELTQATCHVGVDRAASPTAQGAAGSGHVAAARGALSVAMHGGTDVVRCSTVVVRPSHGARRRAQAASSRRLARILLNLHHTGNGAGGQSPQTLLALHREPFRTTASLRARHGRMPVRFDRPPPPSNNAISDRRSDAMRHRNTT